MMTAAPIIIWQFSDKKPGHENQSKGLIKAIMNRLPTAESHPIIVPDSLLKFLYSLFSGSFYRQLATLPKPTYLVAAGRRTHLPMLFAHLFFGGKRIVLMRSIWPNSLFEHMIIPAHDKPNNSSNILVTQGAINNVTPSDKHKPKSGIILIGGPSKHYHWDSKKVIAQISELLSAQPEISWLITNSRRTPIDFFTQVDSLLSNSQRIDYQTVDNSWLPEQLRTAEQVWVSPDSVSMVYEALTSGAVVGCFSLQQSQDSNRVVAGINNLIEQNMLTSFSQWQHTKTLTKPPHQLFEAQRAADWILSND